MINKLFWLIPLSLILGLVFGIYGAYQLENAQMGKYDLYNCLYNNAQSNGFNQNPIMVEKIQNECLCFHYYNYTDLLDKNCSNFALDKLNEKEKTQ